jgi:hypothetical protein
MDQTTLRNQRARNFESINVGSIVEPIVCWCDRGAFDLRPPYVNQQLPRRSWQYGASIPIEGECKTDNYKSSFAQILQNY